MTMEQDGVLQRRFGLVQATALNMINMIGIGPFITIPLLMTALGGPQAMLGWLVALIIVICDGMIWSELGAAMPQSGGSFGYLRGAFGDRSFGRLMASARWQQIRRSWRLAARVGRGLALMARGSNSSRPEGSPCRRCDRPTARSPWHGAASSVIASKASR